LESSNRVQTTAPSVGREAKIMEEGSAVAVVPQLKSGAGVRPRITSDLCPYHTLSHRKQGRFEAEGGAQTLDRHLSQR
jgi:hypothetical protein